MWAGSLVDEVRGLIGQGLREGRTAARAIGYAQVLAYLDGQCTAGEAREEIVHSLALIDRLLGEPEDLTRPAPLAGSHRLPPARFVVTLNEGWRGEVSHCLLTDDRGHLFRYKVKDPSFHNWIGLAMALRGQAISDFPLCNKSFNLSYCGFDL